MARCKVYEIQGPDPAQMAGAVRCHRDAVATIEIDNQTFKICEEHQGEAWELFLSDGWSYAVDLDAKPTKKAKREQR